MDLDLEKILDTKDAKDICDFLLNILVVRIMY